jgi:signal transduction histidine kinase
MGLLGKFYTFRARIAMVLVLTLVLATAVLYRLNNRAERNIIKDVQEQKIDLANAINVAQQSLTSTQYVKDFLKEERKRENHSSHVQRILVVDSKGVVDDSSDADDIDKNYNTLGFGEFERAIDVSHQYDYSNYQIYTFPIQTASEASLDRFSQTYIIIIFEDDLTAQMKVSSFNRLLATGGVLFFSIIVSLLLMLEFTRPVGKLVAAAQRVAAGEFDVVLPVNRRDELGHLMTVFNDMVKGLRERRELEARLYRAEQSAIVGRLASGIAHEVKNPLNYISLTIDYLRSKYAPADEGARERFFEKMDSIKDEIKRLDRLIRNFLSYGRPLNLNPKPISLNELMNSIIALTADQAEQQSIKISLNSISENQVIEADAERLKSCFSNLIMNAQQAMSEGGELRIDFLQKDEGVEVAIADTGCGIEPENIEKIFEPYFSTKDTGTGLGLALVKRIVEGHGGRIRVESKIGAGTTFHVWLPTRPPKQPDAAAGDFHALETLPAI